jgi:hypothetical protein
VQLSIVIVIDIETALKEGTLEQNAYTIHNTLRYPSPWGEGTNVRVPGVANPDGSQAAEAVLNWIIIGVSGLPTTLPRSYRRQLATLNEARILQAVRAGRTPNAIAKVLSEADGAVTAPLLVRRAKGVQPHEIAITDTRGRLLDPADAEAVGNSTPILADIRGDAVDKGVIYPALYGSPEPQSEGWYWSAAVDTSKVGRHDYTLEIILHEPEVTPKGAVWKPRSFSLQSSLDVSQSVAVNGFTGGFCTPFLDLAPPAPLKAGDIL